MTSRRSVIFFFLATLTLGTMGLVAPTAAQQPKAAPGRVPTSSVPPPAAGAGGAAGTEAPKVKVERGAGGKKSIASRRTSASKARFRSPKRFSSIRSPASTTTGKT